MLFVVLDLSLTRGLFLRSITENSNRYSAQHIEADPSVVYRIEKLENNNYKLLFSNNSFIPKFIWVYREEGFQFDLPDSVFFNYATRAKLSFKDTVFINQGWWCCGTGISDASINPFESFEKEMTYNEIVNAAAWDIHFRYNSETLFVAPFDCIPIPIDSNGYFQEFTNMTNQLILQDSIDLSFFIDLYTFYSDEQYRVESNKVRISSLDLINARLRKEREEQMR